jgi:hypothetical protein
MDKERVKTDGDYRRAKIARTEMQMFWGINIFIPLIAVLLMMSDSYDSWISAGLIGFGFMMAMSCVAGSGFTPFLFFKDIGEMYVDGFRRTFS